MPKKMWTCTSSRSVTALVLGIEVKLTGFTSDATYKMTITNVTSGEKVFEDPVEGTDELLFEQTDRIFGDESGVFESAFHGYGCANPYRLIVSENTLIDDAAPCRCPLPPQSFQAHRPRIGKRS